MTEIGEVPQGIDRSPLFTTDIPEPIKKLIQER